MPENIYLNNVTGLLDVDSIVQGLLQSKLKNLKTLQQKKASLQLQVSTLNNLLGAIKDLKTSVDRLNVSALFSEKKVEIGDTTLISGVASKQTPNVSFTLEVLQLPQTEVRISTNGIKNLNEPLSAGNFKIKYFLDSDNFQEFNVEFKGGTIQDLIEVINKSQDKILASLFFDGKYYKIMLTEKNLENSLKETSSESPVIEIEGDFPLNGLETVQEAKNAKIQIGTSTILENPGPTFKDIVPGLNVTVNKLGKTTLTIKGDYSAISGELSKILNSINSLLNLIKSNTDKGQPFQGNAILTQVESQIFSALQPIVKLGIVYFNNGSFSLNTSNLENLAKINPEKLRQGLQDFKNLLSNITQGLTETFNFYKSRQDLQISSLDQKISNLQENLFKEEQKLRLTFSKIETLMYNTEQIRVRLQDFVTSILKLNKSES